MEQIIKFLNENPNGYLATVENGEPRVRPWGFMFAEDRKFYFCTNNTKDVYRQLKSTPYVEFSSGSISTWLRLRGAINFTQDISIKEKALNANNLVKSAYKTPDNPIFEVFYIEHGKAIVSSFSAPAEKFDF